MVTDKLSKTQLTLLTRLMDGPTVPVGAEWMAFYSLERRGFAIKFEMKVYATDTGRAFMFKSRKSGGD